MTDLTWVEWIGAANWWSPAIALVSGTCFGFLAGILPGIGGRIGIILLFPLASLWDPATAAIFLFSLHAVVHTATSIPAIAYGLPSTGPDVATVLDGYPLARMGRAGEALGASLSASAVGGVLGAIAFAAAIPVARPLITTFGPPEIFVLALLGLTMVSVLSRKGLFQGLCVGAAGMLAAMVGLDIETAARRFTFGSLELVDGLDITAIVVGLFVVPEMLARWQTDDQDSHRRAVSTTVRDVFRGAFLTFRHLRVLLQSTLYGIGIGFMPGLGSSVAVWLSYAYAARHTKSEIPFGSGAIAGVIAPEAANNSKEGGAMVPTLFFGIPGSSSMAIMLAALSLAGVSVGPNLVNEDIGLSIALAATVVLANLIAIPLFFLVVPGIVRLSAINREAMAPFAIAAAITAALIYDPTAMTIVQLVAASLLGFLLKRADWPRAPFVLGFVMGPIAETSFIQTAGIWGWSALSRPATLIMCLVLVAALVRAFRQKSTLSPDLPAHATIFLSTIFLVLFLLAGAASLALPERASDVPELICLFGAATAAAILAIQVRAASPGSAKVERFDHVWLYVLYIAAIPLLGLPVATAGFAVAILYRLKIRSDRALVVSGLFFVIQAVLLAAVFDLRAERILIGRMLHALVGV
ncbi:MAG TPA: tripartite tricarboxylate transporter permease [Afifellaceae bacterium]|nr:tripartite tricarboxylate transporter permease [Afifellaceae bacterium]